MKGDPKVIEYLNAGLRHELTAINQYWLHYRLLDNWGYKSLAKFWRKNPSKRWNMRTSSQRESSSSKAFRTCRCSIRCTSGRP